MHHPNYNHEGSHDLSHTFREMATSTGLMGSDVYEVQEAWTGQRDLWVAHCVAKNSPRTSTSFGWCLPTELPKIMGLKGIHSPKALHRQVGLSFCPWCRKEGQNKGTINCEPPLHQPLLSGPGLWPTPQIPYN